MLSNFRGKDSNSKLRFCPDASASFDANHWTAMSLVYLEFYEENASTLAKVSGELAMLMALGQKWPCK